MKTTSIIIASVSIVLSIWVLTGLQAVKHRRSTDYHEIVAYVLKVEKEGFTKAEFDKFALDRKIRQKDVYIAPVLMTGVLFGSTVLAVISLVIMAFKWPTASASSR